MKKTPHDIFFYSKKIFLSRLFNNARSIKCFIMIPSEIFIELIFSKCKGGNKSLPQETKRL